jgi:hypothetical protein
MGKSERNKTIRNEEAFMKPATKKFILPAVEIPEIVPITMRPFTEYFKGFEKGPAVVEIFGDKTAQVLSDLKLEFFSFKFG